MVPDLLQKKPKRDDEQLQQGGTDSRRTGTSATGTRLTYGSKYSPTKQHTYELNTGSKTYTLSADQIVYLREANRSTWADAYGFDDEDQQRRSAGLAPRAVAQQYKNTRLDSWLLENDLPASRYLDSYLESYEAYRAEQAERRRRADAKTELYQSAARASTMLELEGIYNDDRTYEKDGVTATGRDFHSNAFFDLLERSGLSDAYVYAPSTAEKAPEDFASAAEYREYQLKQAAKQEDAAADWDALTSISYEDYLKNSARLIREEKARKLVGDVSVSGVETVGDAIEYSERQRKQDTYNALMGGGDVEAFARDADEDPAAIIAEMEEYGVDEKTLRRTVDAFRDQAFTDEQRQSIDDAYSAYEQRQKEKKQQEKEQERQRQQRQDALEDIFSGAMRGYGGITKKNALAALDEARDAGYDEDEILEAGRAFLERNGKNAAFDREAWNLLQYGGEAAADAAQQQAQDEKSQEQEARQKQRTADDLLKAVSEAYEQEQVDISALTVEEAQGRFLSLLEYRGVDVVDESVADAVQTLLDEGVSYTVLREATAQALSSPRMQYLNNRVTGEQAESYQHETTLRRAPQKLTVSMIVEQGLEQARAEDRRQLAAAYREELAGRGYSGYEIDQALRRGGMADTLDDEAAAHNYYEAVDVPRMLEAEPDSWAALQQMYPGMTAQDYAVDTWENMTAEERAAYVQQFASTTEINTDLHRPHGEQLKMQFVAILPRVIMSTLSGVVNVADMATAAISGREQRWGLSEELSEAAAAAYAYGRSSGQDAASTVISGASDIATEVVRMYALGVAGRGIAAPFAGVMGRLGAAGAQAASGASSKALGSIIRYGTELITHAPNTAPFVISAMGSGYAEAMESGASVGEATLYGLVTGSLEGALEAFNVDSIWGRALGTRRVAEQLLTAGRQAMRNPVGRARLTSLVAGFLGEFTEESASYAASVWMQRATYAPDASFELGEMLSQGLMGGLVGLFGAGAGLGQITESRIVADYILENGDYSPTLLDILDAVQRSESMDAEQRVQYESSGEVLPLAEFRRQAAAARTAEENLTRAQEKLDSRLAELDAEQQRLQADEAQKREDWQAVPADAASVKQKRAAFEAWKDAHGKYEKFVNNRVADETSARTDYEASTRQNQDALRVANDRMNGHYVRLASLFRDDVAAMEHARDVQLTRTDARRRYDAAAQRIDELMDTETERPDGQTDTGATKRPAQYTIQQGGPNDGRAEGSEIHSERPRDLVGGRETAQAQADGSGDTGSSGSGSPRGGVLPQTGVDRRGLRRDGIHVLTESRERLTQAGVTDFGLSVTEDHQAFSDALNRMRAENPNGASVDPQSVDDLVGATTISNPEWTAGGAVQPSGNIVAVFKNSKADSRKNAGLDILFHAIAVGGDRLDCYGIFLVNTYAKGGMVPVARVAYARGINPEMDAHIDSMRRAGNLNFATDPDIYFMKLRAGARYEDLVDDYVNGRYHQYTPEELDALPLMSYDEAEAYRDSLLEQERRQGDYAGAVQELGEAAQQEDAADAEGVDRAAVDAKMRAARAGGAEAAQEAAGAAAGKGQGKDASTAQTAATEAQRPSWADVDAGAQARAVSLGERLGVPVVFEQMPEGFTGRHEDGVIHIATRLPAGEAPELTVLRHELTHYLEGSAEYGALSDYVVQLAQRLNPQLNVNRVLEGLAEEYAARGVELSPDGARREFVARFVQDKLLRDETAIDRLVRERSGVAGRVLNWIEYRIARLKLRGQNSAEARALLEAERLYAKAFARAGTFDGLNADIRYSLNGLTWDEMVARYGAKPAGAEPRTRDEAVPERAGDEQRVSDFLRSFVESDKATDEMVAQVRAAVENGDFGVYTEQSNDLLRSQAQDAIALKGLPRAQEDFSAAVRAGRIDAGTVATGLQLLAEASARGDAAGTLDLVADLCVCATETGRSVQAFSMLKKLGGAGSAYYMQKVEDRLNARYEAEIASGRMLPVKIDGTLMQSLATARTAAEIAQAEEQIARNIGEQLPLSFQQKLSNWRYFAMLANPTTHIRNMTGNALMAGARRVKDAVATGLERAFVPDASERAHAVYSRRSQADRLAYADRSFEAHRQDLMGGGKYGFETFLKQNQRLFEGRALNALAQLNFKALEGEDAIFLRSAYRDAMVQYLTAQRLDPAALTPQQEAAAADWAGQEALRATFRDASQLAALLNRAANTGPVARLAVEGVMPFKKTPINIAKRGVEFSPIGILQGAYQLTAGVKSGRYTVAQGIDRIASGITGTGLMALGAMLARLGVLRGAGEDDRKYETFLRAGGAQGYSLTLGDWSVNISGLAPATIPLFMGVSLYETIEREEAFDMSALVDALAGASDPLMEMSFMSSLNSALESYNQNGLGGALGAVAWNAASSYLSQYVPTFTGKVGQFADPVERTTKANATSPLGGSLDSFLRSVLKKVPGAEATLEPAVDVWGRTQRRTAFGEWALDFFNTFLSPGTVRVQNRTAVDEELIRLVEATGETGFLPTAGQKYFTVGGQRFEMDARQYTRYSQERGQACYAAIKSVLQSAQYRAADDAARAALLEQAVDNAEKTVSDKYKELLGAYDR